MKHQSIADTGAKAGDRVKCVGVTDTGMPGRFRVGQVYEVIEVCGRMQAWGHLRDTLVHPPQPLHWAGFGFEWERVS